MAEVTVVELAVSVVIGSAVVDSVEIGGAVIVVDM